MEKEQRWLPRLAPLLPLAIPYYHTANPVLAGMAKRAIDEALADHASNFR